MNKPHPDITDEISRVRTREEARLIRVARQSGYFRKKITSPKLAAAFKALVQETDRMSQLTKLEVARKEDKAKRSAVARKAEDRRKILLGAFLVAQMNHRPEEFDWVPDALERFLDTHRSQKVAAGNKALMAGFPGSIGKSKKPGKDGKRSEQERKDDKRRLVLAGTFLKAQIADRPVEFTWVPVELERFLDTHPDKAAVAANKALLGEFLATPARTADPADAKARAP